MELYHADRPMHVVELPGLRDEHGKAREIKVMLHAAAKDERLLQGFLLKNERLLQGFLLILLWHCSSSPNRAPACPSQIAMPMQRSHP